MNQVAGRRRGEATSQAQNRQVYYEDAGGWVDTPVHDRATLPVGLASDGPAVIEEYGATTLVGPRDSFRIGSLGEIQIAVSPGGGAAKRK